MKNTSRRKFVRNASLTATGSLFLAPIAAKKNTSANSILSCAPDGYSQLAGSIISVQSGNWSDPATWGGMVPNSSDIPLISSNHIVVYDLNSTRISGINISSGGTLKFDGTKNTTLQSSGNIVVEGTMQMQPNSSTVLQSLQFVNINEDKFVGGGDVVLSTDVGLWVVGNGQLDLAGAAKTSWTIAIGDLKKGATTIEVNEANGWNIGDEIAITPTDVIQFNSNGIPVGFEERKIKSISGNIITLDFALSFNHPKVNNRWTAEVMNLTRNIKIEGTSAGQSHILITAKNIQKAKYVQFRYLGPRKDVNNDGIKELILGRYCFHFHHAENGSRGSLIEGCVARDLGSHAYVPHGSHGITFKNNVSYNTVETPYWYDVGHKTHDLLYAGNIAALAKYVLRAKHPTDEASRSGFMLGMGEGNRCNNNVVAGIQKGAEHNDGGYNWRADNEGVWEFKNNLAHHCSTGLFSWQNTTLYHVIENYDAYYCASHAIYIGAYANVYRFIGGHLFGCNVVPHANSASTCRLRFENIEIDGGGLIDYCVWADSGAIPGNLPVLFRNVTMKGYKKAPLLLINNFFDDKKIIKNIDLVHCTFQGNPVIDPISWDEETIRVQPKTGDVYKITKKGGKKIIPRFAPDDWGTGTGLKGEYFNAPDFTNKVLERSDAFIFFDEWRERPPYQLTTKTFSVRWTGKIHPQFSEDYDLAIWPATGVARLWIDGKEAKLNLVDFSGEKVPIAQKIPFIAGKLYDIKLEFKNTSTRGVGIGLNWTCPSLKIFTAPLWGEVVPQSQLYPGAVNPPLNKLPIANAGTDVTITLPVNNTTLNGSESRDPDGSIVSYAWTKISGPSQFTIANPNSATSALNDLVPGVYIFRLQVTDTNGATDDDDVMITVKDAPPNQGPVANAGPDITITLPSNSTTLNGSSSSDPDGSIEAFTWTKISGPSQYVIVSPNSATSELKNLVQGTYIFRLQVTDNDGATDHADVAVIVNGNEELLGLLNISASPNPSTGSFKLLVTSTSNLPIQIKILTRSGLPITSFSNVANNSTVTVGTFFEKGTYYAVAEQGIQRKIITLIKL